MWRLEQLRRLPTHLRAVIFLAYLSVLIASTAIAVDSLKKWTESSALGYESDTFTSRVELWDRSLSMLEDFPFTGIGIGQFDPVLHALYVPLLSGPDDIVPHAHNVFLEYALELGIPGFVAFAFLVFEFFRQCWRASRAADPSLRWLGAGCALGLVAYAVYGSVDAIGPGARAGLVLWVILGLGASCGNLARPAHVLQDRL
jgi:O-antigen ligase